MKKCLPFVFILVLVFAFVCCNYRIVIHPYTQEYVAGQGNIKGDVDIQKYMDIDKAFEIGANKDGYAVFKKPNKAFRVFKIKYAEGIMYIKKEKKLLPLTVINYKSYKAFGRQVNGGTIKEREQANFISSFFDIYENSF